MPWIFTGCMFFFQAEDGIRYHCVTGVQTCALPISPHRSSDWSFDPALRLLGIVKDQSDERCGDNDQGREGEDRVISQRRAQPRGLDFPPTGEGLLEDAGVIVGNQHRRPIIALGSTAWAQRSAHPPLALARSSGSDRCTYGGRF